MTAAARRLAVLRDGSAGEPLVRWLARAGLTVVDAPAPDDVPDADAVLVLGPSAQAPLLAAAERRTPVLLVGPEHVTNADHTRVLLHFADGVEAEFTASDLAAARKPTFYVLGTHGALVGDGQQERVVRRSPVGLVDEDRFAVSDAPAALSLLSADGSRTALALPRPSAQPFHRELADQLLSRAPVSLTPEGSRRTIAVMQPATASAGDGGRPVEPPA